MLRLVLMASMILCTTTAHAKVLATIGSRSITMEQFNKKYKQVKKQTINPPKPQLFLEDLIRFEVGVMEAEKRGFRKDPLVQQQFRQELYKALLERSLGPQVAKIKVSLKEMKAHYKKNPDILTSHILIEFKADAKNNQIKETNRRAQKILKEVRSSKRPFAELAKLYSDDNLTNKLGGNVGWQPKANLAPNYYKAAMSTKKGKVHNKLVRTRYGYHIVRMNGTRGFSQTNRLQVKAAVFDQKRLQLFNKLFVKLKKKYPIKINRGLASQLK